VNVTSRSRSLIPASYRDQVAPDNTARFEALEAPSDRARRRLREAAERLYSSVEFNRQAHERFRARIETLEAEFETRPKRALMVEDDPKQRKLYRKYFEMMGFEHIDEAYDYATAAALVHTESFDFVLCDIRLASGDVGFDVVTLIRYDSLKPRVPILTMSGDMQGDAVGKLKGDELERWSDRSGATDCIEKPFSFEELKHMVERMMSAARPQTRVKK
jgi:CheY-like chemotaxis protein